MTALEELKNIAPEIADCKRRIAKLQRRRAKIQREAVRGAALALIGSPSTAKV